MFRRLCYLAVVLTFFAKASLGLSFNFTYGANLNDLRTVNSTAFDFWVTGFDRGAADWSSIITNDITLNVYVDILPMGAAAGCAPIIGKIPYAELQQRIAGIPFNAPVFNISPSSQIVITDVIDIATSNLKAIGYQDPIYSRPDQLDMYILMNNTLGWDIDRSDGISGGAFDMAGVFAHEIGHGLGFLSSAEGTSINSNVSFSPTVLDFFRFSAEGVRDISPSATPKYFSLDNGATPYVYNGEIMYFSNGAAAGDSQASHWKGVGYDAPNLSVMNPIVYQGVPWLISQADKTAIASLGYNISDIRAGAPEPSVIYLLVFGIILWMNLERKPLGVSRQRTNM
jgi:hypothetical protein